MKIKNLMTRFDENSLLKDKKSRLSLKKSSFLLDRGCSHKTMVVHESFHFSEKSFASKVSYQSLIGTNKGSRLEGISQVKESLRLLEHITLRVQLLI